jgi:hypothetical protein
MHGLVFLVILVVGTLQLAGGGDTNNAKPLVSLGASDFDAKLDAGSISVSIESWAPLYI